MPGPRATLSVPRGHRRGTTPLGAITRGKTASNRLRRLDLYLLRCARELLLADTGELACAPFVDLGYGRSPVTTLQSAALLRRLRPDLPVLGVEVDPERVLAAQPMADARTRFVLGGFDLPLGDGPRARVVRAMNVLRQYEEPAAEAALRLLGEGMAPGGLLLEGTCDPLGRRGAVLVARKEADGLRLLGLLCLVSMRGEEAFAPSQLQGVLPKLLVHRVVPGEPIHALFATLEGAWAAAAPARVFGRRQALVAFAEQASARGVPVLLDRWLLRRGLLFLGAEALGLDQRRGGPFFLLK